MEENYTPINLEIIRNIASKVFQVNRNDITSFAYDAEDVVVTMKDHTQLHMPKYMVTLKPSEVQAEDWQPMPHNQMQPTKPAYVPQYQQQYQAPTQQVPQYNPYQPSQQYQQPSHNRGSMMKGGFSSLFDESNHNDVFDIFHNQAEDYASVLLTDYHFYI
jgi:hypothetical protein